MILFNSDLDNTLIYSYKHDIGSEKINVELYQNREVSFMTKQSYEMLKQVNEKLLFVPTTTRTEEQYNRIDLGIGVPAYALVCNGGVLLVKGQEDKTWYMESVSLVADSCQELEKAESYLETDIHRCMEVRNIRKLFIFTKSEKPEQTIDELGKRLDLSLVDVFENGTKVYVVPKKLNKGMAVQRLRERLGAELVIVAGDSEFDIPMLQEADVAIVPNGLTIQKSGKNEVIRADGEQVYSDYMLTNVLEIVNSWN